MGKIKSGSIGPITGKVGDVIVSSRNGVAYVKSAHKPRTKKVSEMEKANNIKFADAQNWLSYMKHVLKQGFKGYNGKTDGFRNALGYTLNNSFEGEELHLKLNPALIKISYGDLPLPDHIKVQQLDKGRLHFTWDNTNIPQGLENDQVMLLAYDPINRESSWTTTGGFRKTGSELLPLNSHPDSIIYIYVAFVAAKRHRQSDSIYLGTITT